MAFDRDAIWKGLRDADPAARLSYEESALSLLVTEARTEALARRSASVNELFESGLTATASGWVENGHAKQGWLKRHWRRLFAGTVALTLAGGLTAGGLAFNARTGWFGTAESENGTSEMIDQQGDNYVQLVKDDEPDGMVYPAGLTGADASKFILSRFPAGKFANLPEDGIRANYCHYAQGMWELMWHRALAANDVAGQKNALNQIDDAVTCANNFHVWGDDLFDVLLARQTAARAGNPAPLLQDIKINTPIEFSGILDSALGSAQ